VLRAHVQKEKVKKKRKRKKENKHKKIIKGLVVSSHPGLRDHSVYRTRPSARSGLFLAQGAFIANVARYQAREDQAREVHVEPRYEERVRRERRGNPRPRAPRARRAGAPRNVALVRYIGRNDPAPHPRHRELVHRAHARPSSGRSRVYVLCVLRRARALYDAPNLEREPVRHVRPRGRRDARHVQHQHCKRTFFAWPFFFSFSFFSFFRPVVAVQDFWPIFFYFFFTFSIFFIFHFYFFGDLPHFSSALPFLKKLFSFFFFLFFLFLFGRGGPGLLATFFFTFSLFSFFHFYFLGDLPHFSSALPFFKI
jgi:hypothetical protein